MRTGCGRRQEELDRRCRAVVRVNAVRIELARGVDARRSAARRAIVADAAHGGPTTDGHTAGGSMARNVASQLVRPLVAALRALWRRVFIVAVILGAAAAAKAAAAQGAEESGSVKANAAESKQGETNTSNEAVRAAIAKALPLLAKGADGYMAERKCFACHHQTFPLLALSTAGRRGFAVDRDYVERVAKFVERSLESGRSRYLEGRGQGGNTITAGSALWTLALAGRPAGDTTRMVVDYLGKAHKESTYWRVTTHRPPSEGSHFAATFTALRGLQSYGAAEPSEDLAERLRKVRAWLESTDGRDTEDRAFRLWGLVLVDGDRRAVERAREALVRTQRPDGGWGQLDRLIAHERAAIQGAGGASATKPAVRAAESDAYATGTALVALRQAGDGMSEPAYRRGVAYLLRTQQADGSWRVKSRSKPIQTYFETGFPHGVDQFISSAATGWAVTALAMALPVCVEPW
jgi:hypothetical protein